MSVNKKMLMFNLTSIYAQLIYWSLFRCLLFRAQLLEAVDVIK